MWFELNSVLQHHQYLQHTVCKRFTILDAFVWIICFMSLPYLFEVHYDAALLYHGVLLVVIHQVSQGVEPLTTANVIFTVLLEINIKQVNNKSEEILEYKNASRHG